MAGNSVDMASMLGLAQGTARGGVPSARIAVYKVCWSNGCNEASILAAFEDAIKDGVDILSVSISESVSEKNIHFKDVLSVGSFHAMKHGVLTVFSAGNTGPNPKSLRNHQPWAISVGASTLDRKFITKVKTGNNITYEVQLFLVFFHMHFLIPNIKIDTGFIFLFQCLIQICKL